MRPPITRRPSRAPLPPAHAPERTQRGRWRDWIGPLLYIALGLAMAVVLTFGARPS